MYCTKEDENNYKIGYLWKDDENMFNGFISMGLLGKINLQVIKNKMYRKESPDFNMCKVNTTFKSGFLWVHTIKNEIIFKGYIDCGILGKINIKCLVNKRKYKKQDADYDIILVGKVI